MEFIKGNFLNTTTQLTVNSNTSTSANLFSRDLFYQYYTESLNSDSTTMSITVTFDATTSVSRIGMKDINFKQFRMFYNGSTANSFSLVNADTTVSNYITNSATSKYFRFNTISVSSVTIQATSTIVANQEKLLGLLVVSDLEVELEKRPSAQQYKPRFVPKQIVHKMSDGGTRINKVRDKYEASLNLEYISYEETQRLYNLWTQDAPFNFIPFGTTTGWDALMYECVWDGPFDFLEYSNNAATSGFGGKISVKETPV